MSPELLEGLYSLKTQFLSSPLEARMLELR
jgi:hypothetical protein